MYAIVNVKELTQVCQVRTIEEAYDMLKKWSDYQPSAKFEMMEVC